MSSCFVTLHFISIAVLTNIAIPVTSDHKFSHCFQTEDGTGPCYQECSFSDSDSSCDTLPPIPSNKDLNGSILIYRTSYSNEKFKPSTLRWSKEPPFTDTNTINLTINSDFRYQTIKGFGGAFTDTVVHNLNAMQHIASTQHQNEHLLSDILYAYFSWNDSSADEPGSGGSGYLYGRIPIASTDFSPYSYTYSPIKDDFDLEHFNLTQWELGNATNVNLTMGRMSIIQFAQKFILETNPRHDIHLLATPWTAPPWMKVKVDTDLDPNGYIGGKLNRNRTFWKTYAQYFVRFISEYKKQGIFLFILQIDAFGDSLDFMLILKVDYILKL